jgi:hypothetical protein
MAKIFFSGHGAGDFIHGAGFPVKWLQKTVPKRKSLRMAMIGAESLWEDPGFARREVLFFGAG